MPAKSAAEYAAMCAADAAHWAAKEDARTAEYAADAAEYAEYAAKEFS